MTTKSMLTTTEAASLLGLSRRTLEAFRLRREGPLPVKLGRRAVRYRVEDLEAWAGVQLVDRDRQEAA